MFDISYRNDYLYNCAGKCTRRYPICKLISSRVHNIFGNNIFLFIDSRYIQSCTLRILMEINKSNKNEFLFTVFVKPKLYYKFVCILYIYICIIHFNVNTAAYIYISMIDNVSNDSIVVWLVWRRVISVIL